MHISRFQHEPMPRFTQIVYVFGNPQCRAESVFWESEGCVSKNHRILLANSNQWYFNGLVKRPCHKTPSRCPHRLNLSSQSSRSCARPNTKLLKDKDLEVANSIPPFFKKPHHTCNPLLQRNRAPPAVT